METYNTVNRFAIISQWESFADSSILTENNNLKTNGYKMVRAGHPNNVKRGGVYAFIWKSLAVRNFINSYWSQCLALEVTISDKKGHNITRIKIS